jgi:hypothetical protein
MAQQAGAKLGPLLYGSNYQAPNRTFNFSRSANTLSGSGGMPPAPPPPPPILKLFPEKVEESATVYAVFSLE